MFFKNKASQRHTKSQNRLSRERFIGVILLGAAYYFAGAGPAGLLGLVLVIWHLVEIQMQLDYANFLKEKEIGFHDYTED
jgi:hypothetical protein